MEFAFLPNSKNDYGEKRVQLSHKKKDTSNSTIKFVWQDYYITRISNLQGVIKNFFGFFLLLPFVLTKRLPSGGAVTEGD